MFQGISKSSCHDKADLNPRVDLDLTLWEHRLKKRRHFFRNPFETDNETSNEYRLSAIESPAVIRNQGLDVVQGRPSDKSSGGGEEDCTIWKGKKNRDLEWGEQVPHWLNLFYDLAWTATFASLTSNNKFREPWDSVSYIAFFLAAWWLWASQVCYNVEFYTDDWFHLFFIFLQLTVFGSLAVTTKGFDVRNYILHSPGAQELQPYDITKVSPERYKDERLAKISIRVIMSVLAISRLLLLIQHVRVVICAILTSKPRRIAFRLLIVPVSLVVSTVLFFGAFAITRTPSGIEPYGAKLKLILGGVALLVEMTAHIARLHMDMDKGVRLTAHGTMAGRLNEITTIILGEGINSIAQTFYAVEEAPGFRKATGTSINFLGTTNYLFETMESISLNTTQAEYNATMIPLLLQLGLTYGEETRKFVDTLSKIYTRNLPEEELASAEFNASVAWVFRLELSGIWNTYNTFMDNGTIPEDAYKRINRYLNDDSFIARDVESIILEKYDIPVFYQIVEELLKPSFINARYITGLSGATFICLATLNLIQSWPSDRFQWASVFSRYAMGFCMLLLLLLNFGKYQHYALEYDQVKSKWAGTYRWVAAYSVLPTLASAYALQFLIDAVIMYFAVSNGKKRIAKDAAQDEPENNV